MTGLKDPGSFKDPSGFVFFSSGVTFRQVNKIYKEHYDHLLNSGLYSDLVALNLLIPHEELDIKLAFSNKAYKIIKPAPVSFLSYPYEWCFSQLKDAALVTLAIQKKALSLGMILKDASAYNIQFVSGRPLFVDTLSFEKYQEGQPWVAYRQFCENFLAPLALMRYKDLKLNQLFRVYLDGVPLEVASSFLPWHTRLNFSLLSHLHLHARSKTYFADRTVNVKEYKVSRHSLEGIIDNLERTIASLKIQLPETEWASYYEKTNYSSSAFLHKKQIIEGFLREIKPKVIWDLGANIGVFSRVASRRGIQTISFDGDPVAVEKNYRESVAKNERNILPLLVDLTNPSPSLGWENQERMSLLERGPADAVLALALVHHLAISNNLPFERIAQFLGKICRFLMIEFIPKEDSQVQKLLATREDIFSDYKKSLFEKEFKRYFKIKRVVKIKGSGRIIYLMQKCERVI